MSSFAHCLADLANRPFAEFLFDAAAKATVLLAVSMVAMALLRRSSAAVRHRVWCLTFAALVLLPGLSAALPEWRLAVLPYSSPLAPREESRPLAMPAENDPAAAFSPAEQVGRELHDGLPLAEREGYFTPAHDADKERLPQRAAASLPAPPDAPLGLATLWFVGALVALAPLLFGLARTFVLRRKARSIDDARWTGLLDELRQRLALARRVGLYETEAALMPMTWGVLRPVVMLPRQAHDWPDRLRRFVLLHELAHVKRCDVGFQLLGRAACALYWFHPLAWYALRRLRIERELACDDCVVLAGERASDYAAELLQIACSYRPVHFAAAVAMAQRSNLEHRLTAMFDRACSHLPVSPRAARLLLAGVLMFVTLISAVRLAPRVAADDAAQSPPAGAAANAQADDDIVTVSGKVVDPDGKPFAGATMYAVGHYYSPDLKRRPLGETKSDADGRFELSYPNPIYTQAAQLGRMSGTSQVIAAVAEGFGPGFISTDALDGKPLTLHLVRDDVPIAGRVLDLEGRPVAGAKIKVLDVQSANGDDLTAWIEAVGQGELNWAAARHLESVLPGYEPPDARPIVTDAEGRYRVSGIGRERKARLLFTGPGIAYTEVDVVTRRMATLKMLTRAFDQQTRPVFGADLDLTAAPTQAIVGRVRDAATGEPLAGVMVANNNWLPGVAGSRLIRTTTDKDGRYRLEGLPKMEGIELLAIPNDDQPLFIQEAAAPQSPTLEPITVDFNLHRGIWISGRVTDKATGAPVLARVRYFPFVENEFARKRAPEFGTKVVPTMVHGAMYGDRYVTAADGSYRLVGLPGRAIVGADSPVQPYRVGVGADKIKGGPDEYGHFPTYHNNLAPGVKWPNSMREIDPPADARSFSCDLQLDPGESIRMAVVDAGGKPLAGYTVVGDRPTYGSDQPRGEANFNVMNLGPEETRTVMIRHEASKVGKVVRLRLDEHPKRSLTVKLEPLATIKGRLVNADGEGIARATITATVGPGGDVSMSLVPVTTDAEGRFEQTGVPVGCVYSFYTEAAGMFGGIASDVMPAAGELKDLGDVVFGGKPASEGDAAATKSGGVNESGGEPIDFNGRVIGPDGRPVAEARVLLMRFAYGFQPDDDKLRAHGWTRADGSFALRVPAEAAFGVSGWCVVATKQGYGPGWTGLEPFDQTSGLTLKLAREAPPVEGRVIDMEGRPVVGMKVQVLSLQSFPDDNPRSYLDSLQRGEKCQFASGGVPNDGPDHDRLIEAPKTDDQGSFKLYGIGQNRLAYVTLVGGGVEHAMIEVITHAVPEGLQTPDHAPFSRHVYGNRFTHVARLSRAIVGLVTNAETDEPIAGASVQSLPGWMSVVTRSDGRFSLSGCPKADEYRLLATISETGLSDAGPYIGGSATLRDNRGLEPLEVSLHLYPAALATGRVIDRATGRPVAADVHYYPLYPNKHDVAGIADSGARAQGQYSEGHTGADGKFSLAVLPGPGCLCVKAVNGKRYEPAQVDVPAFLKQQGIAVNLEGAGQAAQLLRASGFPDNKEVLLTGSGGGTACAMQQSQFHAIALFNVAEDAKKVVESIELKLKAQEDVENGGA